MIYQYHVPNHNQKYCDYCIELPIIGVTRSYRTQDSEGIIHSCDRELQDYEWRWMNGALVIDEERNYDRRKGRHPKLFKVS